MGFRNLLPGSHGNWGHMGFPEGADCQEPRPGDLEPRVEECCAARVSHLAFLSRVSAKTEAGKAPRPQEHRGMDRVMPPHTLCPSEYDYHPQDCAVIHTPWEMRGEWDKGILNSHHIFLAKSSDNL